MTSTCTQYHTDPRWPDARFYCTLQRGHDRGHLTYKNGQKYGWAEKPDYADWFKAEYKSGVLGAFDEGTELKTNVQLTLTDLKTIAYYMAEEEDADPTKAKIDKALKEML